MLATIGLAEICWRCYFGDVLRVVVEVKGVGWREGLAGYDWVYR